MHDTCRNKASKKKKKSGLNCIPTHDHCDSSKCSTNWPVDWNQLSGAKTKISLNENTLAILLIRSRFELLLGMVILFRYEKCNFFYFWCQPWGRPAKSAFLPFYDLEIIKIKFVVVFHTVLRQKRVLVTCEDGSFTFFCSGSQCSGCLTDVKFFIVFTIDFIHDTSWQVLIEFVLRFLQDRTNRLDGFMSNIYVELS